ncbi:MAG: STT3 domain-containing protein [Candidatus Methanofastidiosia archaeon]|jgi:asparagine N-glycosylation enzyme membrane subunit Stt3
MFQKYRTPIIIIVLLAVIGVGLYIRSHYLRTEGDYLLAFDPYYHYRMAGTIIEQGARPEWDTIAAHPTGAPVNHPPLFHYYLAYSYKIITVFSSMSLFQWCIYANIIPVIVAIIFAYLAGAALTNELGGIFTAVFVAINGAITSRTAIGYTDTDIWIVLFSLAVTYFLFTAIKIPEESDYTHKKYIVSCLLGFSLFLFALTWTGHWYVFLLVFGAFFVFILMDAIKKEFDTGLFNVLGASFLSFALPWTAYRGDYIFTVALVGLALFWVVGSKVFTFKVKKVIIPVVSSIIVLIVTNIAYQEGAITKGFRLAKQLLGFTPQQQTTLVPPDIAVSVLQRFEVSLSTMAQLFGVLLVLAPFGIIFLVWKRDKFSLRVLAYLLLYLAGTGLLILWGGRYTMLFAVPLILAAGIVFGALPEILHGKITSKGVWAVVFVCSLSVVPSYIQAVDISQASATMNDDTWEALTWISENTPEDALIISGWDMGYWIEAVGKRKTVMNGGHYDIEWRLLKFGKLMETQDEEIAMKEVYGFDSISEVKELREFPEKGGEERMEEEMAGFAEDNAYILVTEWTMLTFFWISYFGNWNYTTGEGQGRLYSPLWIQEAQKLVSATDYTYGDQSIAFSVIKEGENYHSYIRTDEGYIPTMGTLFFKEESLFFFSREEGQYGVIYVPPRSLPYFRTERGFPHMPSAVFFIKENDISCMLTQMLFFNGKDLVYFELVKDSGTAKVYKVHKTRRIFDQGILTKEDTYQPV